MFLQVKKAFTIIEILTIVATIGFVVAVSLPAYIRSQEVNGARMCQENLSLIDGAIDAYVIENEISGNVAIRMDDLLAASGSADAWIKDETTEASGVGLLREAPLCPAGGSYSMSSGEDPVCSLGENAGAEYAPHVYSRAIPYMK